MLIAIIIKDGEGGPGRGGAGGPNLGLGGWPMDLSKFCRNFRCDYAMCGQARETAMFVNETVFIFGAGASWHYGYPTGEDLVKKVIQKARIAGEYFKASSMGPNVQRPFYIMRDAPGNSGASTNEVRAQWRKAQGECGSLVSRLEQVSPLVIDYFLGQNPTLQPIGKLMIAWVILECEHLYSSLRGNINRRELLLNSPDLRDRERAPTVDVSKYKDNWYRFIIHKLITNCTNSSDLLKNKVHFVTFNYDVSLEHALSDALGNIEQFDAPDVQNFIKDNRIMHVYGKVREPGSVDSMDWSTPWGNKQAHEDPTYHGMFKSFLDVVYASSQSIRVIDPADKESDKKVIKAARKVISNAKCIYILGYGFDENNNKRLELSKALYYQDNKKCVLFTNYNNVNRINKSASRVLFHNSAHFLNSPVEGDQTKNYYFEKSVRDTYEALELDFESLEEQLIAGSSI
jgi:hypothetical protein